MNTNVKLTTTQQTIGDLLDLNASRAIGKLYIVPEYQRPYQWGEEECSTLWQDLVDFFESSSQDDYFLSTIVTYMEDSSGEINIVDGQQRITSLFLLLRAFHKKVTDLLQVDKTNNNLKGVRTKIEPCIWKVDPISGQVTDYTLLNIDSRVALDDDKEDLMTILEEGRCPQKSESQYTINYQYFVEQIDTYYNDPKTNSKWLDLCVCILTHCVVLVINCGSMDSALTIFDTLNNRGLPLSDADIFKVSIYKTIPKKERHSFIDDWKRLEEHAQNIDITIDDLFRFYMCTTEVQNNTWKPDQKMRLFYKGVGKNLLTLIGFKDILLIADFWCDLQQYDTKYCTSIASLYLHCLFLFPNNVWRYAVMVYYMKNRGTFSPQDFEEFLKHLVSIVYLNFILQPNITAIKHKIVSICGTICNKGRIKNKNVIPTIFDDLIEDIAQKRTKLLKPLLILHTYLYDSKQSLLQLKELDVEHILPTKWDKNTYPGWTSQNSDKKKESIGNKIPFEKKLNIRGSNNSFANKCQVYTTSRILEVKNLPKTYTTWLPKDVDKRKKDICKRLKDFFKKY